MGPVNDLIDIDNLNVEPFNDLFRRLISSMAPARQTSTLLLTKADQIVDYRFNMDQTLSGAHQGAFLTPEENDLFRLS